MTGAELQRHCEADTGVKIPAAATEGMAAVA